MLVAMPGIDDWRPSAGGFWLQMCGTLLGGSQLCAGRSGCLAAIGGACLLHSPATSAIELLFSADAVRRSRPLRVRETPPMPRLALNLHRRASARRLASFRQQPHPATFAAVGAAECTSAAVAASTPGCPLWKPWPAPQGHLGLDSTLHSSDFQSFHAFRPLCVPNFGQLEACSLLLLRCWAGPPWECLVLSVSVLRIFGNKFMLTFNEFLSA